MLIIYIAALLGILRFRTIAYWKWVGFLFVWMFGAQFLFAGGGTLENPSGDGLILHQIRIATNDGLGVGLFAIIFLVVYWGGAIWIIRKTYLVGKEFQAEGEDEEFNWVSSERKALEAAGITAIAGIFLYFAFVVPRQSAELNRPVITVTGQSQRETPDPIARDLAAVAVKLTREGPKKLDPITTLSRVTSEGRMLEYHHELSRRDASDEALRSFVRKNAVVSVCKNPDMMRDMKDYGVTYRYSYNMPNAKMPVSVDATIAECRAMGLIK